jgi:hypothetical protein
VNEDTLFKAMFILVALYYLYVFVIHPVIRERRARNEKIAASHSDWVDEKIEKEFVLNLDREFLLAYIVPAEEICQRIDAAVHLHQHGHDPRWNYDGVCETCYSEAAQPEEPVMTVPIAAIERATQTLDTQAAQINFLMETIAVLETRLKEQYHHNAQQSMKWMS